MRFILLKVTTARLISDAFGALTTSAPPQQISTIDMEPFLHPRLASNYSSERS